MKLNTLQNTKILKVLLPVVAAAFITSCNKDLPDPTPIIYSPANASSISIGTAITNDTSYSFFKAAATRVGVLSALSDSTKLFTVFLPNNDAFRVSGITSVGVIGALPITSVGAIVQYHIIPGQQYTSADIPTAFPNIQLPSYLTIGVLPGTTVPLNMSTFPSVRSTGGFWDNNIPVISPDLKFKNGVIHLVAAIVSPPALVLKAALDTNTQLNYFKAAIARADSGQTGLNRFDSLLNYAVTNMTVLAPNDAAFQTLIFGLVFQGYLSTRPTPYTGTDTATAFATANGAVAAGPVFLSTNNVSTALVRGLIAYHLLATPNPSTGAFEPNVRVFSVNFPAASATPFFVTTLVNSSFAPHPGIMVNATFTGPFVTDLKFTGLGTFPPGGAPFSGTSATATSLDNHAVNGVYYVIDHVLLPQ
ncbi:MAG: fasciclin domain-containing protein [Ginsengibacter sp.]